jgi:DNA recombination protein RmuC
MSAEILIVLAFIAICFFLLYLAISKKLDQPKDDQTLTRWLSSLQSSFNQSNQHLTSTLQSSYKELHERLDRATAVIGDLKKEAGVFSEVGRSMKDLQDYLKSPKLRGNIGEQVLKDLIGQMFPKRSVFLQHAFKSGSIVDAAIQTDAGLLPIDSKFPLENFQKMLRSEDEREKDSFRSLFIRDIKKHIKDISSKYILPSEGTVDFALMYLPSEAVYYEVVNQSDLMDFARDSRVYPVSPTTLYAHLQTILLSFEGKKIESKSKEIYALLRAIGKDYEKLQGNLSTLNRHITNAANQMSDTNQTFTALGQKISSTKSLDSHPSDLLAE